MKVRTIDQAVTEICNRNIPVLNPQEKLNEERRAAYDRKMVHWFLQKGLTHPAVRRKFYRFH